jgi:hypothetical protein
MGMTEKTQEEEELEEKLELWGVCVAAPVLMSVHNRQQQEQQEEEEERNWWGLSSMVLLPKSEITCFL